MRMRMRLAVLGPLVCCLPAACTVGPNYRAPPLVVPPKFAATALVPSGRPQNAPETLTAWWQQFHDAQLNALIARALRGNLDLKSAASRVREAREQLIVARAAQLPVISGDTNVSALHLSQNSGISEFASLFGGGTSSSPPLNGFTIPGYNITTYTLGFDASWELDLFGGVRRSIEAARAAAEQAIWNKRDSEVSIAAEVANDYWLLRSLQREIATTDSELRQQSELLTLLQARRRFGFVTEQDVRSQAAQVALVKAALPDLESARQAQIHALGVLAGEPPEALEAQLSALEAVAPPQPATIPVGLPSELLRRRPDVRAAERALAASSARIGVAVDALYPKLSLTGAADLVSIELKNLLDASSAQFTGAGALSVPLFQGGRGRANVRMAEEENRQALYAYQNTVLGALRDVEDALTRYGEELNKNRALHEADTNTQRAADIVSQQFQNGLNNIQPVLVAELTALQTRMQVIQSDSALASDLASLYKALGGGWSEQ